MLRATLKTLSSGLIITPSDHNTARIKHWFEQIVSQMVSNGEIPEEYEDQWGVTVDLVNTRADNRVVIKNPSPGVYYQQDTIDTHSHLLGRKLRGTMESAYPERVDSLLALGLKRYKEQMQEEKKDVDDRVPCKVCNRQLVHLMSFDDPNFGVAYNLFMCPSCGTLLRQDVWLDGGFRWLESDVKFDLRRSS